MIRYLPLLSLLAAATPAIAQSWLYVARPSIELSASDKFATAPASVEFVVTLPDGSTRTATAAPKGDIAGSVRYPGDFPNAGTKVGDYQWTARANGKDVVSGKFSYRPSGDGQVLFVPN